MERNVQKPGWFRYEHHIIPGVTFYSYIPRMSPPAQYAFPLAPCITMKWIELSYKTACRYVHMRNGYVGDRIACGHALCCVFCAAYI